MTDQLLRRWLDNHCQAADQQGMSVLCECKLCLDTRAALSAASNLELDMPLRNPRPFEMTIPAAGAVPQQEPQANYAALAGAMKKMLPPALLAEVVAHLDPVTPFVKFLRNHDGPTVGRNCNSPRYPMSAGAVPQQEPQEQEPLGQEWVTRVTNSPDEEG